MHSTFASKTRAVFLSCAAWALFASPLQTATAGPASYRCIVKDFQSVAGNGTLSRPPNAFKVGHTFQIDRGTGTVTGDSFGMVGFTRSLIFDHGSTQQPYTLLTFAPGREGGLVIDFISVSEYAAGRTKPFLAVSLGSAISGVCE